MTHQRRALRRNVVGAALVLLLLASACADDTSVGVGDSVEAARTSATPIATTAPAIVSPAPTSAELPTQIPLPTSTVGQTDPSPAPTVAVEPTSTPSPVPTAVAQASPTAVPPAVDDPGVPATPTTAPPAAPSTDSQEVMVANGSEVFTFNCARCHGENGLGSLQYSTVLVGVGSKYTAQGMIAELTNGHPVTFGFADRLSADEIASVVAYVKAAWP